jgi:hypothetical protein
MVAPPVFAGGESTSPALISTALRVPEKNRSEHVCYVPFPHQRRFRYRQLCWDAQRQTEKQSGLP